MAKKKVARKRPTRAKKTAVKKAPRAGGKPVAKPAKKRTPRAARKTTRKRAAKRSAAAPAAAGGDLLTLTEVSQRTGISMPTLQRYKKEFQNRLQTVGKGRTQRYKADSLDTFRQIKQENLKKRGRPRKSAAKPKAAARPAAKPATAGPEGLISLSEIGRRTGISYPTLLRYVKVHRARIPSHGTGRKRRFPEEAVAVFQQLRQESRRGRRKGGTAKKRRASASTASRSSGPLSGVEGRLRQLEKGHAAVARDLLRLRKALARLAKV